MNKRYTQLREWVRAHKIRVICGVFFLVITGIVAAVIYSYVSQPQLPAALVEGSIVEDKAKADSNVAREKADGKLRDESASAIASGDAQKVAQLYDEAVKRESDTARKIQLYVDQSAVLYEAGRFDDAVAVVKQSEALSTDRFLTADWLSRLYEDHKDYTTAAEYYRVAAEWAHSDTNRTGITKQQFEAEAKRVEILRKQGEAK